MTADTGARAQIMDVFGDQLAATGYPGISLVGVARTAGIQKPSISSAIHSSSPTPSCIWCGPRI